MAALVNRRRCYTGNSGGIDYSKMYFTIESLEDGNAVNIQNVGYTNSQITFYYSTDDGENWNSVIVAADTTENIATLDIGEKVIIKQDDSDRLSRNGNVYHKFTSSKNFKVQGNIMSLLRGDNFVSNPELPTTYWHFNCLFYNVTTLVDAGNLIFPFTKTQDSCCKSMFRGCTNLINAPQLPAIKMSGNNSYADMFRDCTSLISAPKLPATTLGNYCYNNMFNGCSSLVTAPVLPATTLKRDCYNSMFKGCTSLVNAPLLPATTSAESCYNSMFYGCTALTEAPALPATTLVGSCYANMFYGCTSLVAPPNLPAETLVSYCYSSMFEGCVSLTTPPILPATTLATKCYDSMFKGCTSLVEAPELPATELAIYCYQSMFEKCVSLEEAPVLPATTLVTGCYKYMFCMSRTDKLTTPAMTKAPILPATDIDILECYQYMFQGNGNLNEVICLAETAFSGRTTNWLKNVSSTGTFIKSPTANWGRNESGIPSGWTVYSDGLLGISISGIDVIDIRENTYSIAYNPSDTLDKYKGVTWSVLSGNATITQDGVLTPTAIGNVVIQAVSTYDSTIVATKTISVQEYAPYFHHFTIESLADSNAITIQNVNCSVKPTFYYSLDDGDTWSSVTMTQGGTKSIATINTGDKILFKSTNTNLGADWDKYNRFNGSKNFKVYGNIMSLLYGDDFVSNTEFANGSSNNFVGLFKSTTTVVDASNLILPSTTVYSNSYNGTFRDCANLVYAPKLPAINLNGKGCYASMFEGCINLIEAPELSATTLSEECYARMFCMSRSAKLTTPAMTKSPLLPAATLATNSYKEMFKGNGNLVEITCLATNVASNTSDWVANISSTGTFKKNANMSSWTTGTSGIPSGWTVVDYVEE